MKNIILPAIILPFLILSCTDRNIKRTLNDVESYISEKPDSALAVLDSLSKEDIRGEKANAKFSLLYSMALDKNHINLTADSIIKVALSYYRNHGNDDDKAQSWYYIGRIQQNAGNYMQAAVSFSIAEKHAGLSGNDFYSGMAHRAMGDIYGDTYNHIESLKYYRLAYEDFERAGARKHSDYALLDLARAYNNAEMFDRCEETCLAAIEVTKCTNDTILLADCLEVYASAIQHIKRPSDPEKVTGILNYISDSLKQDMSFGKYLIMTNAYIQKGDLQTASDILTQLKPFAAGNGLASAKLAYSEYKLNSKNEDYRNALKNLEKTVACQDSLIKQILQQSLLSAQRDMLKQQVENDRYYIHTKNQTILILTISAAVIIFLLCYIYYRKMKTQEKETATYIHQLKEAMKQLQETGVLLKEKDSRIAELDTKLKNADISEKQYISAIDALQFTIHKRYETKLKHLDELYREYYAYGHTASRYKRIFKQAEVLIKSLSNDSEYNILESMVNLLHDNVIAKARAEFKDFKEDDFRLLCFWYAGFSASTISILMDEKRMDIIYSRKSRLKKKIENSNSDFKNFILENLP